MPIQYILYPVYGELMPVPKPPVAGKPGKLVPPKAPKF